uniref:Nodal n=1 Tax=Pogona vitticeps TaxID=103695 RepID=A0A6J0SV78_9SAUR
MQPLRWLLFLFLLLEGVAAEEGRRGAAAAKPPPRLGEKRCAPSSPLPAHMVNLLRRALPQADVIRSLRPHSVRQVGQRWSIIFNLSICQQEELQLAELRLQLPGSEEKSVFSSAPVWVDLYHQQEIACPSNHNCSHIIHIGSFGAPASLPSSWIVLEVTEPLLKWAINSSLAEEAVQRTLWHEHQHTEHFPRQVANQCGSPDRKAFLVLFFRLSKEEKKLNSSALLQTVKGSKFFMQGTPKYTMPLWRRKRHRRQKKFQGLSSLSLKEPKIENLCHRVDFYVDFEEIGWGSWIIYPKRYNAFRCDGKCPVPLEEKFLPTNNAYMQSVLKYYHPEKVPAACCIPVRLSPLSLLYYEEGRVSLGHHEDMIVEECGCR